MHYHIHHAAAELRVALRGLDPNEGNKESVDEQNSEIWSQGRVETLKGLQAKLTLRPDHLPEQFQVS